MTLRATWWYLYSSCLRSTWFWKRGCFLTGSSGPNCGETTLSTGAQESAKTNGLNMDLAGCRRERQKEIFICRREEEISWGQLCGVALTGLTEHIQKTKMATFWWKSRWVETGEKEATYVKLEQPPLNNHQPSKLQSPDLFSGATNVNHDSCHNYDYLETSKGRSPPAGQLDGTRHSGWNI